MRALRPPEIRVYTALVPASQWDPVSVKITRRLSALRKSEHSSTVQIIEALVICHRERAYLPLGYSCMWDYLTQGLRYSPGAASRRYKAMKCALKFPQVIDMLRDHRVSLSTLARAEGLLAEARRPEDLLGEIVDIERITSLAHNAGARVVVDGVAYAPHRAIDVSAWNVDWYAYSTYKVYGPHMAALWGRRDALAELPGPNHFFVREDDLPYKFEVGGPNHEGCAGICGLREYLAFVVGEADPLALDRSAIERAFEIMTACELPLQARLIEYLRSRDDVRIIGPSDADESRVGTISFVHDSKSSAEITAAVDRSGIGIRHGHMYAYHLCEAAGLDPEDGVVRTSLVHYNTMEEIERLVEVFDAVL